jgi:hypothetical protein
LVIHFNPPDRNIIGSEVVFLVARKGPFFMSRQFNFYSKFTCFKSCWEAMKEMDKVLDRLEGRLDRLTAVI